ncbi:MAG: hypothetical protein ACPLW8_03415 [Candidatus Bathyarchaeales archaeon]
MSSILLDKWTWIIILSVVAIIVLPLVVVWCILQLPPIGALLATIVIILLWGVASGYKDWVIAKHKEEAARREKEAEKEESAS